MTKFAKNMLLTHLRYSLEVADATTNRQYPLADIRAGLAALIVQVEECPVVGFSQPPVQAAMAISGWGE